MQKQLMEAYNRSGSSACLNIEDKPLILTIEHNLQPQAFKQKKVKNYFYFINYILFLFLDQ